MNKVTKRDGRIVNFDKTKIINAIEKAMKRTKKGIDNSIAEKIANSIEKINKDLSVEEIQDLVEKKLMTTSRKDVAKEYITYRNERTRIREQDKALYKEADKILNCENITNDNANIDQYSFSGKEERIAEMVHKSYAVNKLFTDRVRKAYNDHWIYIHDLNKYAVGEHNCLFVDVAKLLKNGFSTRNGDVRGAHSVSTAFQLVAVIFQCQSQVQFGGVASAHIDTDIAPYVKISFKKHFKDALKYIGKFDNSNINKIINENKIEIDNNDLKIRYPNSYQYAYDMLNKEGKQGAQALYHNLNTLESRAGSQVPFTSINFGCDTTPEGRLVSKWILEASIDGIGKFHRTSIFPISIFQYKKGINDKPGTPNYDLKLLAIKSMSKRIYPNWVNCDFTQHHEDPNDPDTRKATMGCLDGNEVVTYKYDNKLYVESIKRMWDRISDYYPIQIQGNSKYVNSNNTQIYDSKNGFVNVKRIICNDNNNWMRIKFSNGRSIVVTDNHPFLIQNKGITLAKDLNIGDTIDIITNQYSEEKINYNSQKAWLLGFILCDGCYSNNKIISSIALDSENDIEAYYIKAMKNQFNVNVTTIARHRGKKGNYKDLVGHSDNNTNLVQYLTEKYGGLNKDHRHIPNEVFSWNKDSKISFLAGMIDADGYLNSTTHGGSIVQIGSTNKELAIQQMLLAQSLNMPAKLYLNQYNKNKPDSIRYRIEFYPTKELVSLLASKKKRNHYIPETNDTKHYTSIVTEITYLKDKTDQSYDVTTASNFFDVSGIYSHNCRTQLGYDRFGMGYKQVGRGNICPTTMILPKLGIEYGICLGKRKEPDLDGFWKAFDKLLDVTRESLLNRFTYIAKQSPKSAPFMYNNGTMADTGKCKDNVYNAVKHGTLAIGFIGLSEMCQALFGKNFVHDKKVYNFALSVIKHIYDFAKESSEKYNLNFSTYATPAEGSCETIATNLRKEYGSIPFVTDKKYTTNSSHVPVWEKVNMDEKLNLEAPFTFYETGGCITYLEIDSGLENNPKGVEKLIDYAMSLNIPYLAINFPIDTCNECGFQGTIPNKCPRCGSNNIKRLRRVTGYLSTDVSHFNKGKQQEVEDRVKHNKTVDFGGDNI